MDSNWTTLEPAELAFTVKLPESLKRYDRKTILGTAHVWRAKDAGCIYFAVAFQFNFLARLGTMTDQTRRFFLRTMIANMLARAHLLEGAPESTQLLREYTINNWPAEEHSFSARMQEQTQVMEAKAIVCISKRFAYAFIALAPDKQLSLTEGFFSSITVKS